MADILSRDQPATEGVEVQEEEQTAIEAASVIHLLRVVVEGRNATTPPDTGDSSMAHDQRPDADQQPNQEASVEEAGCLLWDMSASRAVARLLMSHRALDALELAIGRELTRLAAAAAAAAAAARQAAEADAEVEAEARATGPAAAARSGADDSSTGAGICAGVAGRDEPSARGGADASDGDGEGEITGPGPTDPPASGPRAAGVAAADGGAGMTHDPTRLLEICLGTLANLVVTHPTAAADVASRPELLGLLLAPPRQGGGAAAAGGGAGALWVDDARVLSELFRLLSLALRAESGAAGRWLAALRPAEVLRRAVWVAAATADATLFSRVLDALVSLLHAAASTAPATGSPAAEGEPPRAAPASPESAAEPEQAAAQPAAAAVAVGGCLLECGLLELVHGLLHQALRACMPLEERWGDAGVDEEAEAAEADGAGDGLNDAAAAAAEAEGGGENGGDSSPARDAPSGGAGSKRPAPLPPGPAPPPRRRPFSRTLTPSPLRCSSHAGDAPREGARGTGGGAGEEEVAPRGAGSGQALPTGVAEEEEGDVEADAAAAAVVAAAAAGPELVSPGGPLAPADGAAGPRSPAAALLALAAGRRLSPGLVPLLLGLLRHHTDSSQVLEGLLVLLVDLGPHVQEAVAASAPAEAVAVAARLVEILQESSYSVPAGDAAYSVVHPQQQGAWYLLAAALRGMAAAAATAAAKEPSPADKEAAAARAAAWAAQWQALGGVLGSLPALPLAGGCGSYARAACAVGLRLVEIMGGGGEGEGQAQAPGQGGAGEAAGGPGDEGRVLAAALRSTLAEWGEDLEGAADS
ncbi:hypothetical protein HYH03_002472 [Edaphochlamys debaryana]|uniref:Uncharacterized protein n=1 Tax=Edaphochlamys debaryana TaxID=47281 RepID=A0A836C3W1_9CHLO|nr:hypothetical protein HYH03_002472 [Edaphochlamys debaryana]|eukprot:KAG2499526.1 hypothetical protein HYH03_002472 [Edaphochlamys debaryana]